MTGWSPSPSQPKPAARGSGTRKIGDTISFEEFAREIEGREEQGGGGGSGPGGGGTGAGSDNSGGVSRRE